MMSDAEIRSVVSNGAPAFALLHRPGSARADRIEVLAGTPVTVARLADLPVPARGRPADRAGAGSAVEPPLVAVVPYRQITERDLACVDDGQPLVALRAHAYASMSVTDAVRCLPDGGAGLAAGAFDVDDAAYEATIRRVIATDIGRGEGSNFVVCRSFRTVLRDPSMRARLAIFRRLLMSEQGAYWTFLVHWNGRTIVGATPECHVRQDGDLTTMNPISGTYRYPGPGATTGGLLRFLADRKETEELLMVVDEELKMMARVCPGGGRLRGPYLRPMSRLAHTGYIIEGRSDLDPRDVLRLTMPAPTVTGSPLANACRVVTGREGTGRGYYGGVLALFDRRGMDAALLIRAADIDPEGRARIAVGATLVRHSDPAAEAAETRSKAEALLRAMDAGRDDPVAGAARAVPVGYRLRRALAARNRGLSGFWRERGGRERGRVAPLVGRRLLIIDAEDDFTGMLAVVAAAIGLDVEVRRHDQGPHAAADLVLLGPGPGDPRDRGDARIARLHEIARSLLAGGTPVLAVCLGHQVLADELGLAVRRLHAPAQGVQRRILLDGRSERVGFYNTFVATSATDAFPCPVTGESVRVLRDRSTGVVHALIKRRLRSIQFHVESVLTENGSEILHRMVTGLLADSQAVVTRPTSAVLPLTSFGGPGLPSGK